MIMNRTKKNLFGICIIVMILIITGGFIFEGVGSIPDGDDFNYMHLMRGYLNEGFGWLVSASKVTYFKYTTWQGTWFANLLMNIWSPYLRNGIIGYSLANVFGIILFVVSLLCFISCFVKRLFKSGSWLISGSFFIIVWMAWTILESPQELFYWFACACGYLYPICGVFFGFSILISMDSFGLDKSKRYVIGVKAVLGITLLFFSMGGTLQIAGLTISLWLFFVMMRFITRRNIIYSGSFVIMSGGLLNLLAPGNFVRNSYNERIGVLSQLLEALKNSSLAVGSHILGVLTTPVFWVAVCLIIVLKKKKMIILDCDSDIANLRWWKIVFTMWVIFYSVTFPVCLGTKSYTFAVRNNSIVYLVFFSTMLYASSVFILFINVSHVNRGVITMIILVMVPWLVWSAKDSSLVKSYTELLSGDVKTSYQNWKYIYDVVNKTEDEDVYINIDNCFINDLMTKNTVAFWQGEIMISPSYLNFTGKRMISVTWRSNRVETIEGVREE